MSKEKNKGLKPEEIDSTEIMDNVPEAAEENETAEQIENDEMTQIDALCKQLAEEKEKVEKEKKEYLFLMAEFDNFRKRTLNKFLEQNGVKAIESTGADFDPEFHEAIAMVPVEDEAMKGKVIDTPTKGYTINGDKVLRFAKVAVGQ